MGKALRYAGAVGTLIIAFYAIAFFPILGATYLILVYRDSGGHFVEPLLLLSFILAGCIGAFGSVAIVNRFFGHLNIPKIVSTFIVIEVLAWSAWIVICLLFYTWDISDWRGVFFTIAGCMVAWSKSTQNGSELQ